MPWMLSNFSLTNGIVNTARHLRSSRKINYLIPSLTLTLSISLFLIDCHLNIYSSNRRLAMLILVVLLPREINAVAIFSLGRVGLFVFNCTSTATTKRGPPRNIDGKKPTSLRMLGLSLVLKDQQLDTCGSAASLWGRPDARSQYSTNEKKRLHVKEFSNLAVSHCLGDDRASLSLW